MSTKVDWYDISGARRTKVIVGNSDPTIGEYKKGDKMADYNSMETAELVKRLAWDKATSEVYASEDMEIPEALLDSIEQLKKCIRARKEEAEARELKLIEQKLDNLKTAEEKRSELIAKRDRLLAKKAK